MAATAVPPVAAANERPRWLRPGRRLPGYGGGWVPGTSLPHIPVHISPRHHIVLRCICHLALLSIRPAGTVRRARLRIPYLPG